MGVEKFYMPAIDSTVINDLIATENKYPQQCFAMMGLHPCSVKENYKDELEIVEKWLSKTHVSGNRRNRFGFLLGYNIYQTTI